MSLGPRPLPAFGRKAAATPDRAAPRMSPGLALGLGMALAVVAMGTLVLLDYNLRQEPHRLVKILLGATLLAGIALRPRFGLYVLPVLTPFLGWLPRVPVPGVNPLNMLLFLVFFVWAIDRVFRREALFRRNRLGAVLLGIVGIAALSIVRGAAFPTGYFYDGLDASLQLFRSAMTFAIYFVGIAMVRGESDRRRLTWAILLGLLAEALATVVLGRSGRGSRAEGSFGQANDLGAFLAMFTVFAGALFFAARGLVSRLVVGMAVLAGSVALVFSLSRGAMVAFACGMAFVALRSSRTFTFLLLAVMLTSPFWAPDFLRQRISGTQVEVEGSDETTFEGATQLRIATWRAIGTVVSDHPLEGVGFTGLRFVLPEAGEALGVEVKDSAHNTYLRFLAEMGLFGLLLFLWLLFRCWRLARDGMRVATTRFDRQLSVALAGATLALAVGCAFGDRFFNILITGNFWMACALVNDLVLERTRKT